MKKIITPFSILFLFLSFNIVAQTTYLVKDLSTITLPSNPKKYTQSGSLIYFSADNGKNGRELWRTDGTTSGTFMVKDINPGINSGLEDPFFTEDFFTDMNGVLFFFAEDSTAKKQLWKTDGTLAGTSVVTNFTNGTDVKEGMININGTLFFIHASRELWKSDGTAAGTVMVKNQISTAGTSPSKYLTNVNGTLFFVGYDVTNGYELWKSDGTTGGTILVKDINPGTADAFIGGPGNFNPNFKNINGVLYFAAKENTSGVELWKSDGTGPGTIQIKNIDSLGSSNPGEFTLLNGELFFRAYTATTGYELWKTDGTPGGTNLFMDIDSGLVGSYPQKFNILNNTLYFITSSYQSHLWKSDGTVVGTSIVLSGSTNFYYGIQELKVVSNDLYVSFVDTLANMALWKGDGNSGTFQLLKDLNNGPNDNISLLTAFNGNLIFSASDSIFLTEIFISDGTASGTRLLKDINEEGDSFIDQLADVNGTLFFSGRDNSHGGELWKSNGNATGTKMIIDANANGNTNPYALVKYQNAIYYRGSDGNLWKSDGTLSGTTLVAVVSNLSQTKVIDNMLFFQDGYGVWRSDGTGPGTVKIYNGYATDFVKVGNDLFINTFNNVSKIDLSTNTSSVIKNLNNSSNLTNFKNKIYFNSFTPPFHILWESDGTPGGTVVVDTIQIISMITINNKLFISGYKDGVYGLFHTESPSDSIALLKEVISGGYSYSSSFYNVNGTLFFTVDDGINGKELWKSDGTPAGTSMVKNINSSGSSNPANFASKNGILYFSANDGTNGVELWKSDGTNAGTNMLADINLNGDSNPEKLTISGDYVYFVANDGITGKELWTYGINTTANCFAYYSTAYDTIQNNFTLTVDPITSTAAIGYHWDFGDGTTSALHNPSHTYTADGIYNLCLKVNTAMGDSCLYCHELGKDSLGNITRNGGFNVTVQNGNTGIDASLISNKNNFVVYPNPSNGEATIVFSQPINNASIRIMNIMGQKVSENNNISGNEFRINISDQPQGIFFIEIDENGKTLRTKLVKK